MRRATAIISILTALALGLGLGVFTRARVAHDDPRGAIRRGKGMVDAERVPVGTSPVLGDRDALVTVVIFADFECQFCDRVRETLARVRREYGADVRLVWKNNPLPFHLRATPAAEAAMEAHAQGGDAKFWAMHDLLFDNQQRLDRADLERYAQRLGLDLARFRRALDGHAHVASIERDMALARSLSAQGTPNFFINGFNVVGAQPFDRFKPLLEHTLSRARTIVPREQVYARMVADPLPQPPPPSDCCTDIHREVPEDPTAIYRVPVGHSPQVGPADALVTVVTFADFQCPFSARVQDTLRRLRRRYGDDLRVVWKNEPLAFHDGALPAARLAMEAFAQGGGATFWAMHDLLFDNQQHLDRADLERYAQRLGLDMARVRAALDRGARNDELSADRRLARQVDVNGTPHFFINGRRLVGAQPEDAFVRLIDEVKRRAEERIRTMPGTTRANVYERTIAGGVVGTVRAQPAPTPPRAEDHDFEVRDAPHAPSLGGTDARVVIQHFGDFQCPFCGRVAPTIARIRRHYGDRIRFVWRDYPLPFHGEAMLAAEAAREAHAQGGNAGFWRFHDALFADQAHLERADLERVAQAQGLDMARFRRALDDHRHRRGIGDDVRAADDSGAEIGTPGFFIAGRFVAGPLPFEEFQRRIDAAFAAR